MTENVHELAPHHLPFFIPTADGSDQMMTTVLIFLIAIVLLLGTFYLYLHSLPERLAHRHGRIQFELVAVLGLLALFTHNQIFWVAALVLAFIELPDFASPLETIATSTKKIAAKYSGAEPEPDSGQVEPTDAAAMEAAARPGAVEPAAAAPAPGEAEVVSVSKQKDGEGA